MNPGTTPAAALVHEEVMRITYGPHTLWGVLSLPTASAAPSTAVVVVVGGPQVRAGSHRQFVLLARSLARAGHAVLRFDVRGMGDSDGEALPHFEHIDDDIGAALAGLHQRLPALQHTALWGLCDGASAALMYVQRHPQAPVSALCLANPWARSAATQAQTTIKHYYKDRLRQRAFWLKLLQGGVARKAVSDLVANWRQARKPSAKSSAGATAAHKSVAALPYQTRMALGWQQFGKPILLLLSENDYTAKEFVEVAQRDAAWQGALGRSGVTRADLPGTDHTCSDQTGRLLMEETTARWLHSTGFAPPPLKAQP